MQQLDPKSVWLFFINGVVQWFFLLAFLMFVIFSVLSDFGRSIPVSDIFKHLLWIVPVLLVILWVFAKLTYRFYRYELHPDGFRKEQGIIWKKYVTIPYERIQNVDIYRGVFARLLGLSDLNIQTAGASAQISRYGVRGAGAEGRLFGLSQEVAESLRDELVRRARRSDSHSSGGL